MTIMIKVNGTAVATAHVLMVLRFAPINIIDNGTNASITHQNNRCNGCGSSLFLSPGVAVDAIVKAAPSKVVAKNSIVTIENIINRILPIGNDCKDITIASLSKPCPNISTTGTMPERLLSIVKLPSIPKKKKQPQLPLTNVLIITDRMVRPFDTFVINNAVNGAYAIQYSQ